MKSRTPRACDRRLTAGPRRAGPRAAFTLCGLLLAGTAGAEVPAWGRGAERPSRALVPLPGSLAAATAKASAGDPAGDTFGSGPTQIDITGLAAELEGTDLVIEVTFAAAVSPPDSGRGDALDGFLDIDADQDGSTGDVPWVDFLTGVPSTGMGNEFYVDLFTYSAADGAADVVDDPAEVVTGRAPVSFTANAMTVRVPLALLGGDDGAVDVAAVVGTLDEPTDVAPNMGSVASGPRTSILLNGNRFRATLEWSAPGFSTRPARVSELRTAETGFFYFLSPDNIELLVKVIDGCSFNGRYWVFFGGATDVAFTLTVTDTQNPDQVRTYHNLLGHPADAVTDTAAFATCL